MRATLLSQIELVADEQNKRLAPLTDDLALLQSGLDSLCFAILIARIEAQTGLDPFTSADGDVEMPVTVGDLIALYDNAGR